MNTEINLHWKSGSTEEDENRIDIPRAGFTCLCPQAQEKLLPLGGGTYPVPLSADHRKKKENFKILKQHRSITFCLILTMLTVYFTTVIIKLKIKTWYKSINR